MKGKLSIGRVTSNKKDKDYIKIQFQDVKFKMVLIAEVSLEDFASALTGCGAQNCHYLHWNDEVEER